jgi:NADPH:quinone reductase-like Zn-dependent oxidoreductase
LRRRSAPARSSPPRGDEKLERARELGADAFVNHVTGDVGAAVKEATEGRGVEVVLEHVGQATWQTSLQSARAGGRIVVCGATSGPNPRLHCTGSGGSS